MKHLFIKTSIFFFLIGSASTAYGTSWHVYKSNNDGAKKILEKGFYGAYQKFLSALEEDPLNPIVQLNLGMAFEMNEEYDKAEQAYQAAAELAKDDPNFQFVANFNIGVVRGKKKDIDGALVAYQKALDLNPNSQEVKTNIELLIQNGGGGGEGGENQDQGKSGDKNKSQGQGEKKDQQKGNDPQYEQPKKPQPKPFESKELTPADVKKILDEIKNQEQSIRAQEYKKSKKESPRGGKDW